MKKLISLALSLLMCLSCMGTTLAAQIEPENISVNGWSGWSGSAVTTKQNPVSGDATARETMVKLEGGSAEYYFARWFTGVFELSVDVCGTGTISFDDSNGRSAGTITLADGLINTVECAYDAEGWNTIKLFVLTGSKKAEVYLGDTYVTDITLAGLVRPTKLSVNTTDVIYLDNIEVSELKKENAYPDNQLNVLYETDAENPTEGWVTGSPATVVTEDGIGENIVKFEQPGATGEFEWRRALSDIGAFVFEAEMYQAADHPQSSSLDLFMRNSVSSGEGRCLYLLRFGNNGHIRCGQDELSSAAMFDEPVYKLGEWFKIKVEVMTESQCIDAYVATLNNGEYGDWVKINREPVRIFFEGSSKYNAEIYETFEEICFSLISGATKKGLWYINNVKISEVSSQIAVNRFKSSSVRDFNSSGATSMGSSTSEFYYHDVEFEGEEVIKMEDTTDSSADSRKMDNDTEDISGDATFSVDLYDPYTTDTEGNVTLENTSMIELYFCNNIANKNLLALGKVRNGNILEVSTAVGKYPRGEWFTLRVEIDNAANQATVYINDTVIGTYSRDFQTIASLRFYMNTSGSETAPRIGYWYMKNIKLDELIDVNIRDSYAPYYTYTDNITRGKVEEISLRYVEFEDAQGKASGIPTEGGKVTSVTIEKNAAVSAGTKLLIGAFDGDILSDARIIEVEEAKTTYTLEKALNTTATTSVKVFIWNMNNLTPVTEEDNVKKADRTKLVLFGDSITATYITADGSDMPDGYHNGANSDYTIRGWGQMLGRYVNTNKLEVLNYAISGATSSDFLGCSYAANPGRKTYYDEALALLGKGDYAMISLTTNDSKYLSAGGSISGDYATDKSFAANIWQMITDIKAKGATPILVTTHPRCYYNKELGRFTLQTGKYQLMIKDMERIARENNIPIINLYEMAIDKYDTGNVDATSGLDNDVAALYVDEADSSLDNTHLNAAGASGAAALVAEGMAKLNCGIEKFVR